MSLLEKAMKAEQKRSHREIKHEDIELALAWLSADISISQVQAAYGRKSNACMYRVANALKKAYVDGIIIKREK